MCVKVSRRRRLLNWMYRHGWTGAAGWWIGLAFVLVSLGALVNHAGENTTGLMAIVKSAYEFLLLVFIAMLAAHFTYRLDPNRRKTVS